MKTVLVIEDDDAIRENICELLELEGYKVLFATNGKSGIALLKENKTHIILCDIVMSYSDGYEMFNKVKSDSKTSNIPFIFLSAVDPQNDATAELVKGADGYIQKPFETKELFDTILNCLKN